MCATKVIIKLLSNTKQLLGNIMYVY